MGPDELIRISYVARRHYQDRRSRVEIAEELDLSRFKIARMLEKAEEMGIVRFEISVPGSIDLDLSVGLKNRFGLKRALAVTTPSEAPEVIQDALGSVAAQLLSEIVVEGDFLGLTAGRTLDSMSRHLKTLPYCDLVALGGVAGAVKEHGVEIIRRIGQISKGATYPIFAPLFVTSPVTARALRQDRLIADAYSHFDRVTKGIVAIGSWSPPDSQLYDAAFEAGLSEGLLRAGVIGEVGATLFDADGRIIEAIDDRSIAITAEQLKNVPEVIAVGGGTLKTLAVRGAIKSGIVDSLITDAALAERLLSMPD